eukprot:gene11902-2464_t
MYTFSFPTTGYKHSYIRHPSDDDEITHGFHLSKSYPAHRIRKQNIESENPSKRGFLANLATLLNDADVLSKKNSGIAKSAITPLSLAKSEPTDRPSPKVTTENSVARSLTERHGADKNEPTPSAGSVESTLKIEGKDSAPIFALFHGKIVPLGKLPDSSFKKSHTETRYDENKSKEVSEKLENHKSDGVEKGEAKSEVRVAEKKQHTSSAEENEKKDKSKSLSPLQLSRLSSYFHNLDSKNKADTETRMVKSRIKDVTGTAKDEVPEIMPAIRNSEFLKHVKGIVLDDGKMVSFKGKQAEVENEQAGESEKTEDAAQRSGDTEKSYAIDSSLLSQLTKSKEKTADPVARDTQSVMLNLDTLKGLLKKSNDGVSLAKLLNKPTEGAAANTQDEDPGTIEDFAAGGLKKTNEFRAEHHSPPLIWSDDLASEAQKMAEHLADLKSLEISNDLEKKGYGENVAKVWANFKTAGEAATNMWYHQSENYHFDDPHLDQNTGQFAQLIWKDSKELGMGVAKSIDDINNKYVYVVALYRPPGNIETTLRENVLKRGNDTTDVYSTFFKRSQQIKESAVLLPKHEGKSNDNN